MIISSRGVQYKVYCNDILIIELISPAECRTVATTLNRITECFIREYLCYRLVKSLVFKGQYALININTSAPKHLYIDSCYVPSDNDL